YVYPPRRNELQVAPLVDRIARSLSSEQRKRRETSPIAVELVGLPLGRAERRMQRKQRAPVEATFESEHPVRGGVTAVQVTQREGLLVGFRAAVGEAHVGEVGE